jgi:lipid-binding SYLF domain-containing protein
MKAFKLIASGLAAWVLLWPGSPVMADWQANPDDKLQVRAAKAIDKVRNKVERSAPYFEDAYAMAVWPGITRVGFGFGGAYGKGVLIEGDAAVGTVSYWQGSSGIQAGAKNLAIIIFFRDKETLEALKQGKVQFTGQAGIDIATVGIAGTPAYSEGVAIITATNFGLMAEFSAAGVKFNFKPYAE